MKNNIINQRENKQNENKSNTALSNETKHFIDDDLFNEILAIREHIYQQTEVNISPRKIVNLLLKKSDFISLRDQLIKQYS